MDGRPTNSERSVCLWAPAVAVVGGAPHVSVVTPFIISCRVMMLMMSMPTQKARQTGGGRGRTAGRKDKRVKAERRETNQNVEGRALRARARE